MEPQRHPGYTSHFHDQDISEMCKGVHGYDDKHHHLITFGRKVAECTLVLSNNDTEIAMAKRILEAKPLNIPSDEVLAHAKALVDVLTRGLSRLQETDAEFFQVPVTKK